MNLAEGKLYVSNYDNYVKVFGEKALETVLKQFDVTKFSTTEYVISGEGQDKYFSSKGYPLLLEHFSWDFEEWRGKWMRKVSRPAKEYRVADQYQLAEAELLRQMLLNRVPYLCDFAFKTYHFERIDEEIYIDCEHEGYLYVPIQALISGDWQIVVKRMTTYWKWYYNKPDRADLLKNSLTFWNQKQQSDSKST